MRRAVWAIGKIAQHVREDRIQDALTLVAIEALQELASRPGAAAQPFAEKQLERLSAA